MEQNPPSFSEHGLVEKPDGSLQSTREFWDTSPCDGQADFEQRKQFRYRKEPWLTDFLKRIAASHDQILEIGCGQGTDAILLCSLLSENGRYEGLDYSPQSIQSATVGAWEVRSFLRVQPIFRVGNAENLDIADNTQQAVYSMGVLHHTANEKKAFAEILRVLQPGGKAYLVLYRRWSLKVGVAKVLRFLQAVFDTVFMTKRIFYRFFKGAHLEKYFGTMILECFGVPYLKCYTKKEIQTLFAAFEILDLYQVGYNVPWIHLKGDGRTMFGYFWVMELKKPLSNPFTGH
ncbi:MAG: Methyltransferase type 11 [Magnetococcales bacterium]|nr:Methyltransferase type 11 [Magnetococcales bacterium]